MQARSYHDIPIRSHCIVVSLTTSEQRTSREVAQWIKGAIERSGKAFSVMVGPAGDIVAGSKEAYEIASAIASMPEEECPEHLRSVRAAFISKTTEQPKNG
jgi:hypothetical protein